MSEAKGTLQTINATVQDIVAPDVRELKVRMSCVEDSMKVQFEALKSQSDAQFRALLAAIAQSSAETELSILKPSRRSQ